MRYCAILASFLLSTSLQAQRPWKPSPDIADTDPLPPEKQVKKFHLPRGFEIQLVAAEPDINKPINIAFDAKGRLWVTGSVEYPYPAKRKGRDKVWILEDFAASGKARKITTFADDLNIPIGVLPFVPPAAEKGVKGQGAIVFSIPNIYRLTDTKGEGKADKKEVILSGYGFKDTHGMTGEFMRGFDGWVYACHGFANHSEATGRNPKAKIEMISGNTYRFKPDGSRIEYFTHGQVNPFGLCFDAAGNLYSCDCHTQPIYQLLKGAWYPSFEKPHDGLGFGPEMMTHSHGSTAIAGITVYEADAFPAEFRHNVLVGNVVTNRINRDRIEWTGSTPKAIEMPDFLKCDDPWFRPVDIKLGPDGALYVADFYNRIIGHYEVPLDHPGRDRDKGRIWRIVYKGVKGQVPLRKIEDLTRLSTPDLVKRLRQVNLTVRLQALNLLVDRGGNDVVKHVNALLEETSDYPRAGGLWVLERLGRLDDKRLKLDASLNLIRVHVMRILAEREKWKQGNRDLVLAGLRDADALVRRIAVSALAAHPQPENIAPLLDIRFGTPAGDTHLIHAIRMALRDQLQSAKAWAKLPELKEKESRAIADVCPGLRSTESAEFLLRHVERYRENAEALSRYASHIARHAPRRSVIQVLELDQKDFQSDLSTRAAVYRAVQQGLQARGQKLTPPENVRFEKLTVELLGSNEERHHEAGVELAASLRLRWAAKPLLAIAENIQAGENVRRAAVAALAAIEPGEHVALFARLLDDAKQPIPVREEAGKALGGDDTGRAHLLKALATAPARLERSIAIALVASKPGAEKLLDAVAAGKASARLLQDQTIADRLRGAGIPDLEQRVKKLTVGLPTADQRLQKLIAQRRDGFSKAKTDVALGAKMFTKHCASCHQIHNQGAKLGPQLDGIGIRGLDRILEDVLDPSRNVDQAFRSTRLELKNGKLITGLFLRQEGAVFVMADAQGKEQRVAVAAVERRRTSALSPMPANVVELMADDEFYHLLAFLLDQRPKK